MGQPKHPPTSLRIPVQLRERVEKWAFEQGIAKNAAYVQLIDRGLAANGPHPGLNERPMPQHRTPTPARPVLMRTRPATTKRIRGYDHDGSPIYA